MKQIHFLIGASGSPRWPRDCRATAWKAESARERALNIHAARSHSLSVRVGGWKWRAAESHREQLGDIARGSPRRARGHVGREGRLPRARVCGGGSENGKILAFRNPFSHKPLSGDAGLRSPLTNPPRFLHFKPSKREPEPETYPTHAADIAPLTPQKNR